MNIKTITICGGGNATHAIIPILRKHFHGSIRLFLSFKNELDQFNHLMTSNRDIKAIYGSETFFGSPDIVSDNPEEACLYSDLILLPLPAFAHESVLKKITPFVIENGIIGAIPARGGFEFSSLSILKENEREDIAIFGMQTLPWACRIKEYARQVEILGEKKSVGLSLFPHEGISHISETLSSYFSVNIEPLPNMLTLSLANIGQIVHPGIMYGLFKGNEHRKYEKEEIPLFYHGVTGDIAEILEQMSNDILTITREIQKRFKKVDLTKVLGLKDWLILSYKNSIEDSRTLETSFLTNNAYRGLFAPMKKLDNGYYSPDFKSRYLTEDVPFGLIVTKAIAMLAQVDTPTIDEVIKTVSGWMEKEYLVNGDLKGRDISEARIPQNYSFNKLEQIIKL